MTVPDYVPDVWYMIAGRIAPPYCCTNPSPVHTIFKKALFEVSRQDGDIDEAVRLLQEIVSHVPPEWMVFEQAGAWNRLNNSKNNGSMPFSSYVASDGGMLFLR